MNNDINYLGDKIKYNLLLALSHDKDFLLNQIKVDHQNIDLRQS